MKKYSSTPRTINTIVFALLTLGFGFLAVWFTFLVVPYLWSGVGNGPIKLDQDHASIALCAMFAAVGVGGTLLSALGLVRSVKSLRKSDDELVRRSFDCYFALGYLLAGALFCNAGWLVPQTTINFGASGNVWFVVIVYIVALILVMVGTNIPLVKVYEDDDEGVGMARILLLASLATGVGVALPLLYAGIVTATAYAPAFAKTVYLVKFFVSGFIPCLGALVAALGLRANAKGKGKPASIMLYSSLGIYGLGMIAAGIFAIYDREIDSRNIGSFFEPGKSYSHYVSNSVLSFVFGGIVVLVALILICVTLAPKKEKKK